MKHYWTAPELWPGATFVCLGNGPSLSPFVVEGLRERQHAGRKVRIIATNDAYKAAPWADVLYFCDDKWWQWRHKELANWKGLIVRLQGGLHDFGDPRIKVLKNLDEPGGLAERRDGLHHGKNSGYQAIGLAVHLGAKRIVLLGYDMQASQEKDRAPRTHWFGDYPGGTSPNVYTQMLPWFDTLVQPLAKRGIEIVNCTPNSAIRSFPRRTLEDALAQEETPCRP